MDGVLCDELLQEIIHRLPPSSAASVSLVSRRWLSLLRSSTTSLSLRIPPPPPTLSSILAHYPSLSALSLLSGEPAAPPPPLSSDALLLSVAASPSARRLSHLRFLPPTPLSPSVLLLCSSSLSRLTVLQLSSLLPLSFRWLAALPSLRTLSVVQLPHKTPVGNDDDQEEEDYDDDDDDDRVSALPLESLSLSGIRAADRGASWLWRRCANLRHLRLRACEGTGDDGRAFPRCLAGIRELELRKCRAIALRVLLRAAEHCRALASLLVHDGSSREAVRRVILARGDALRALDLRLPLDVNDEVLLAAAANAHGLTALRLRSCCLVTGDGLRSLAQAPAGAAMEELVLVNCTVVEREPGLLTFLGQSMRQLQRLDLSYNEMLADKEMGSMLASCGNLVDIRLRCCRALTDAALFAILKCCGERLEVVDIYGCPAITTKAIDVFLVQALGLVHIFIEENKISEAAKDCVSRRAIIIG